MGVFRRFWWGPDSARTRPGDSFPTASFHVTGKCCEFFFRGIFLLDVACYVKTVVKTSSGDEPAVAHEGVVVPLDATFFFCPQSWRSMSCLGEV